MTLVTFSEALFKLSTLRGRRIPPIKSLSQNRVSCINWSCVYRIWSSALFHNDQEINNYSPSITSVDIIIMLMMSSKNICVNVFLMRARPKRYIKSLTRDSIKLYQWISKLKIFKSPFKFTWNAPLQNKNTGQWRRSVSLKCCPDCINIVKLNSKHFSNLKKLKRM